MTSIYTEMLSALPEMSGLENREYGRRDPTTLTIYPQKLALTSPTSGGGSVGIVRSRSQATKLLFLPELVFKIRSKNAGRKFRVRFPEAGVFSRLNSSGAHPASCPMRIGVNCSRGHGADHSPRNVGAKPPLPPTSLRRGALSIKPRDNFGGKP
jgi:hypothetical protein